VTNFTQCPDGDLQRIGLYKITKNIYIVNMLVICRIGLFTPYFCLITAKICEKVHRQKMSTALVFKGHSLGGISIASL